MTIHHHLTRAASQGARRPAALVARAGIQPGRAEDLEATARGPSLAHVSHELRTPIHAVLGYAALLHEGAGGALPPLAAEMVDRIARSAQHLRELVDDLLDIARLDAGTARATIEEVSMGALLRDALATLEPQARSKGLALGLIGADVQRVRTDARRVRQIVLNLAANAIKFTERGGVTVALEAHRSHVAVHVADTGVGIAREDQAQVFDEFVQVGAARGGAHGGVGLGLAISRRLARLLGGDLTLRSEPGRGSCFTLTLPAESPARPPVEGISR
jgi:signal transduction histidine kinase